MESFSLSQIYKWKQNSSFKKPWDRQYLNIDFLKTEKKRIEDVHKWYVKFLKARLGESLDEVWYYVLPAEIPSEIKVGVELKNDYNYAFLSALKNCEQLPILMIIPKDKSPPNNYTLIRIIKSKKDYIDKLNENSPQYVINVEEFEEIPPESIYLDVPYERKGVYNFIKENLIRDDDLTATSFQSSISGSPFVFNKFGGISYSIYKKKDSFSDTFMNTLKLMQPPEFTDIINNFPKSVLQSKPMISYSPINIKFSLSENIAGNKNFYRSFSSNNPSLLNYEIGIRSNFGGEYSIACSLNPSGEEASEIMRDIFKKFVKTEITSPFSIEDLKEYTDLERVQRNINEDLWIQIANQKQNEPIFSNLTSDLKKLRGELIKDWEIIFEAFGLKNNQKIQHEINLYSQKSYDNILRVAQSLARDKFIKDIPTNVLNESYKLFTNNYDKLINNDGIVKSAKIKIYEMKEDAKFNSVRSELSVNVLNITQLYENVKSYFKDILELQNFVDDLLIHGYLYQPTNNVYSWI